jgi:hypothetical protein
MTRRIFGVLTALLTVPAWQTTVLAQSSSPQSANAPTVAFDITKAEIDEVLKNAPPNPPDRQLRVVDMGKYNLGIGIIHRGPTNDKPGDPIPVIYHDFTPETYIIVSGSGVLTTGGVIENKRASGGVPNVMNGVPECAAGSRPRAAGRLRVSAPPQASADAGAAGTGQETGGLDQVRTARTTAARDRSIADDFVVVGEFFTTPDGARRADPDRFVDDLEPAVGCARVIDEPGDVATDRRVAAPRPVDPKDPDAALSQVALFTRLARIVITQQLAVIVDDAGILRNRLGRKHAVSMNGGFAADDFRKSRASGH